MVEPITVLLAEDHVLLRRPLRAYIDGEPDLRVVAEVGTTDDALAETLRLEPDIVLLDIEMPGCYCFDAARTIKTRLPETHIVFLSGFHHDRYVEQAIDLGASGYLTKLETPDRLVQALRAVMAGEICYSREIRDRLVVQQGGSHSLAPGVQTSAETLTAREKTVLHYIAQGLSKKQISLQMHVSASAVDRHTTRLMSKLNIHDRVELTRYAIREGLVQP